MGLFDNQQHIARAVNWFKLDMRLLTLQVETVSLDRQQGMLLSDEDVEKLVSCAKSLQLTYALHD